MFSWIAWLSTMVKNILYASSLVMIMPEFSLAMAQADVKQKPTWAF